MSKTFISLFLCGVLLSSLVVPSLMRVCDIDIDSISWVEMTEEEQNNGEKEINPKLITTSKGHRSSLSFKDSQVSLISFYSETTSIFVSEIYLPPPELI